MPSLLQRFARARNSSAGDDPAPRPKTSAEELTTSADVAHPDIREPQRHEAQAAQTDGGSNKDAEDSKDAIDSSAAQDRRTSNPDQVTIGEGNEVGDSEDAEEEAANPAAAAAAAAAQLKKASQKAKAAAALKKMKARSGFSLWNWLPTFYDPVEDTIRSRVIAVLAVAVIPAMLAGLLLEPMITDVADVTRNSVILFSPLFMPMDPMCVTPCLASTYFCNILCMYVGVPPAKGYEFRFVVRNSKYWPQPGKLLFPNPFKAKSKRVRH
jgi:hypothetical protein